jgi:LysR family glycine cleavage system transcriptional activator
MPRLGKFNRIYPHIKLDVSSEGRVVDLQVEDVDLAIRYGNGDYPGLQTTLLLKEEVFPVCSPCFLQKKNLPRTLEDLKDHDLIHDTAGPYARYTGLWETWLEIVGVKGIDTNRGTTYNLSEMVMNAAVLGQGIALGRSVLVADDIAEGRLVRLFDISVEMESSYYIVTTEENKDKEKIRLFREWLLEEAKACFH